MLDNQTHYLAKTHPFKNDVIRGVITAGQTVSDVLAEMQGKHDISKYYQATTYVEINGTPIHPDRYDVTFIDRNAIVVIQYCVPQGGGSGSNPLRMVLTIALAAVAMAVPGMLAAGSFFASGLGAGLLSGGIMMVGSMVINAICPATSLSSTGLSSIDSTESSVYSITGMTNYNPAYKPLPIVLGKVRFAPPYGAIPYTRIDGNDQYLHTVVVWGQGELSVTGIKIGETDISEYSDLTIATNYGRSTDTDLGLYPYDVYEDEVGAVVAQATPLTRTGQLASNATQIDIVFNNGLTALNDSGNRVSTSVTLQVHYRLTGETAWNLYATKTYTDSTAQPLRKSIEIKHTTAGQYDIKVTRLTADKAEDDSYLYNEFYWSILRSISYADPVTFDCPIAETQIVIKATDQLSGNVDTINGVCQSVCLDYDATTDTWIKQATQNPASLFRHVLQGGGCAKVIEDRLIDIPALEEWHTFCEDNEFYYNYVHDAQQSALDVLNDICHAGRATFVLLDSIRSVVIDRRRTLGAVQMFTPANSVNFSMKKTFAEEIHGYRINFNNEGSDYAEDEVFSYAEGYTKANATLLEALEFVGVTNPTHVQKLGKYHLATRIYRSELFTWDADWEHVVCSRGDLVRLSNPAILVAQCSGLVIAVDRDNKTITLDQSTQFTSGKEYGLAVRTTPSSTDASVVYTLTVTADDEDATLLRYTEGNAPVFTRGDVYSFGELGLEAIDVIITSKRPSSNMRATLTAIQYSWDEIEAYLAGEYPDHNSVITAPVYDNPAKPPVPSFASITGGAAAVKKNADGSITGRVIALVTVPSGNVAVSEVHVEIRESGGSWTRSANLDPADAFIFENIDDGMVELRARTATESGLYSAWFYTSYAQDAVYSAPSPVTALDVDGAIFANKLAWTLPADFASASMIEVWCSGDTNNLGLAELVGTIGQSTSWTHTTLDPTLVYYYWLRVRTAEDKYSTYFPVSTSGGIGASPSTSPDILLKQLQGERIDTNLGIDGDLVATGTITSTQMATHDLFAWSVISENYVPGVSGYLLDAPNNIAEFNNINFNLNYLSQDDLDVGLDTDTGGLIVRNTSTNDYVHLSAGGLNFYINDSGTAQLYKSVEKMETGEASHGAAVIIPGVWKTAPSIIITPTSTQTYNPGLGSVSQILNLKALNLTEYSSRKYSFTVQALLEPNDGTVSAVASSMIASKSSAVTGAALTTTSSIGIVLPGTGATVPVSFNGTINYTVNHDGGGTFRILVEVLLDATVVFSTYIQPYGVQSDGAEPRYTTGSTTVSATVTVSSATSYTAYPKIRLTEQYKATTTWATMTARVGTQTFWMSSSISTSNLTVSYTTGSLSGIGANGKVAWTAIG